MLGMVENNKHQTLVNDKKRKQSEDEAYEKSTAANMSCEHERESH